MLEIISILFNVIILIGIWSYKLEGEFHIKSNNAIKYGGCREVYVPYEEGGNIWMDVILKI